MNILFLCVGNSARSQIAEGLAKEMFSEKFHIKSAGSKPSGFIHSGAIKTMNNIGIDISNQSSKGFKDLDDEFLDNLDYIITLCSEDSCPVTKNNVNTTRWSIPDPASVKLSKSHEEKIFNNTRDDIYNLIKSFVIKEKLI